jgi:hypothetical protein
MSCRYGDWEPYADLLFWVREVNPTKHREIVDAIDWDQLGARAVGKWQNPPREFRLLLLSLAVDDDGQPIRKFIMNHIDEINCIDSTTAGRSPEAAVAVVRKGGRFNLEGDNQSHWELQAWALVRVAELDRDIALSSIELDRPRIVAQLTKLEAIDCEKLPKFLRVVDGLSSDLLQNILQNIDMEIASSNWSERLQQSQKEQRRPMREFFRIVGERSEGELKTLAELLSVKKQRKPTSIKKRDSNSG